MRPEATRRPTGRLLVGLWLTACFGSPGMLRAQETGAGGLAGPDDRRTAAVLFADGVAAYQAGQHSRAAHAFEAAFDSDPQAASIYNAGRAWEAAGQRARAADAYAMALDTGGLDGAQRAQATEALGALRRRLAVLEADGSPGTRVTVQHVTARTVPVRTHLSPGRHPLHVDWPDGTGRDDTLHVTAGKTVVLVLEAPTLETDAPGEPHRELDAPPPPDPLRTVPADPDSALPAVDLAEADPRDDPGLSTGRMVGWTSLGLSAGALGAGITLGFLAVDARDAFEASDRTDGNAHDQAERRRLWANVSFGIAAAFGAVGLWLVLRDEGDDRREAVEDVALGVAPGRLVLRGTF